MVRELYLTKAVVTPGGDLCSLHTDNLYVPGASQGGWNRLCCGEGWRLGSSMCRCLVEKGSLEGRSGDTDRDGEEGIKRKVAKLCSMMRSQGDMFFSWF